MNDQELKKELKELDSLLDIYLRRIKPIAIELAERKSKYTRRSYDGNIGCWETGIETLCMHIRNDSKYPAQDDDSSYKWADEIIEQFFMDLQHICLQGVS